jgi:drug/metabolite transporter (DMT)-like permease
LNPAENRAAGIGWMLATMVCFITLDAIMKYSLETYSLVEVTWARFFFATIFAVFVCGRDLPHLMISHAPFVQTARSVLLMATTGLFNAGISTVPLAMGTTIMFMSPILVTLLSIVILGEHVGLRRWAGIVFGFLGALIVMRFWETGLHGLNHGALFLLCAALTNASYQIATRRLRNDSHYTSLLFTAAAGALVTSILLPWHWSAPTLFGWILLIASGLAGCLGHLCLIKAFQAAPASVVAPFSYSSLIWATLFGFVIWRDVPQSSTLIGAALIIGSGLYIYLRERQVASKAP